MRNKRVQVAVLIIISFFGVYLAPSFLRDDNFCLNSKIEFDSRIMDEMLGDPLKSSKEITKFFKLYPFSDRDYTASFGGDIQDVTFEKLINFQRDLQVNTKAVQFKERLESLYKKNEKKIIEKMCHYLPRDESFYFKVLYINFIKDKALYAKDSVFIVNPSSEEWEDKPNRALELIIHNAFHVAIVRKVHWPSLPEENVRPFDRLNYIKQEIFFEGIASYVTHQVVNEIGSNSNTYFAGGGGEYDFEGISNQLEMKKILRSMTEKYRTLISDVELQDFKDYFFENNGKLYLVGAYLFRVIDNFEGHKMIRKVLNSENPDMLIHIYNKLVPENERIIIITDNFF